MKKQFLTTLLLFSFSLILLTIPSFDDAHAAHIPSVITSGTTVILTSFSEETIGNLLIEPTGTLVLEEIATLIVTGTLENNGLIELDGRIELSSSTFTNSGIIDSQGTIEIESGSTLINSGTINAFGNTNGINGWIHNRGIVSNSGTYNNFAGILQNYDSGSITNNGIIENDCEGFVDVVTGNPVVDICIPPCYPPRTGDWIVTNSCTLEKTENAWGNVEIQNNSVLTIPSGLTLAVDLHQYHLLVKQGSGIAIQSGGGIVTTPFSEIGISAGVDFQHFRGDVFMSIGAGSVAADFDNDGFQDIFVANENGANGFFINNGDWTFTDLGVSAGLQGLTEGTNGGCSADFDNDGDVDLYVTAYGTSKLFKNEGGLVFTDITNDAGVGDPDTTYRTQACVWGDYDSDGFVDLMVQRHLHEDPSPPPGVQTIDFTFSPRPVFLFHNEGDGTFTNVTTLLGDPDELPIPGDPNTSDLRRPGFQPGFFDYDNDGDQDIYTCNDFGSAIGPNVLWRNDGMGLSEWTFTDVSVSSNANVALFCMGSGIGDYDRNGFLDFYGTNFTNAALLKNNGDGTFTNVATSLGVERGFFDNLFPVVSWGAYLFDYDNNGWEDIYQVAGNLDANPSFTKVQPNAFFKNEGNEIFNDVSIISGLDDDGFGRGGSYADFDNDGCLDFFLVNVGDERTNPGIAKLYRNNCNYDANWLTIKTTGTTSNRDGIGSRITVTTIDGPQIREIGAGWGHQSQNMLPAHFGLGDATLADVEIKWPSGIIQTLNDVPVNQLLSLVEP